MLMFSFVCVLVCVCACVVAQSEERIGRWVERREGWKERRVCLMVEVQASSHPLCSFCIQIKESSHDLMTALHCLTTMTRYSINRNGS